MAAEWGSNSLASGQSAGWVFVRPVAAGFLPVLSVRPLSPSFTDGTWSFSGLSAFPVYTELGISTTWSQLTNDGSLLAYFLVVMNGSNSTIEYAFLEADL
jgi:hypothetical protein